jgi:uncharacterized protein (UPF0332 family)
VAARLARELAGEGARQGQPRTTNLRRAISSAYYALFHAISLAVAMEALPNAVAGEQYGYTRYVNHMAIKRVCEWVSGDTAPRHVRECVTRLRSNRDLSDVASAFAMLHEQREAADYDHDADFARAAALAAVRQADRAINTLRAGSGTDDFRALFGLVALQTSIRGS